MIVIARKRWRLIIGGTVFTLRPYGYITNIAWLGCQLRIWEKEK